MRKKAIQQRIAGHLDRIACLSQVRMSLELQPNDLQSDSLLLYCQLPSVAQ